MVQPISWAFSWVAETSLWACAATRSSTGRQGRLAISQVLLNWISAPIFSPACRAACQCASARGPGPTEEMEYSPTVLGMPPRSMGRSHSLTDISQAVRGRRAMMSGARPCPRQPQSDRSTRAAGLPRWTPASRTAATSEMMSASLRAWQR